MGFLYLVGERMNALATARSVTSSGAADANFPPSALFDDIPGASFAFAAAGTDDYVEIDANMITNDDFEGDTLGAAPANWTTRSGTPTVESGGAGGSAKALQLNATDEAAYVDIQVVSGRAYVARADLQGTGTETVEARVQNRQTGAWLTSAGAWQASATAWASETGASFVAKSRTFTVEDYATTRTHLVTLRYEFRKVSGTGAGKADNAQLYPQIDFASIHNHNIDPLITVKVQSKMLSGEAWTDRATLTQIHPAFYSKFTVQTDRRWRFLYQGINTSPIRLGEAVLGLSQSLARVQNWGWATEFTHVQDRAASVTGGTYVRALLPSDTRIFRLPFRALSEAERDDAYEILRRCKFGEAPILIIPDDTKPAVAFCRFRDVRWQWTYEPMTIFDHEWVVEEQPGWIEVP
jgi:hypothetical protein